MRILQLGVGSVGEVIARTVAGEDRIERVVLADIDEARLAEVVPKLPVDKDGSMSLDVESASIPDRSST